MAFTNFALFGGAFFTPVLVGKITESMGWRWPFYFVAIFSGALLPVVRMNKKSCLLLVLTLAGQVLFYVPETAYRREFNTDMASKENLFLPERGGGKDSGVKPQSGEDTRSAAHFPKPLPLFNGRKTDESMIKLLARPFPLLVHPAIFWGMLTQGALIGWTVMIGVVLGVVVCWILSAHSLIWVF